MDGVFNLVIHPKFGWRVRSVEETPSVPGGPFPERVRFLSQPSGNLRSRQRDQIAERVQPPLMKRGEERGGGIGRLQRQGGEWGMGNAECGMMNGE